MFLNNCYLKGNAEYEIGADSVFVKTRPATDLWQRTYYLFRNDSAPMLLADTDEEFFSFTVKTSFKEASHRFDQCGIVVYQDPECWLKASVEQGEGDGNSYLGSVVTNSGYSDWATNPLKSDIRELWYRLSRRRDDFRIEYSFDGKNFIQMRICHLQQGKGTVAFGIYACSPEDSSFRACFSDFAFGECLWQAHDGQQPDPDITE